MWRDTHLLKFELVLLSSIFTVISQVTVVPNGEVVAGLNGDAAFTCISSLSSIVMVEWLINGTSFNDTQYSGVTQDFTVSLRFRNVPAEYNHTRIQCIADSIPSSGASTLLVQGLLSSVGSLLVHASVEESIYLNWTAPFTLDITISLIDITYCVDVVSSTSSATLHSECGITETEFTYPLPSRSWCHEYNFTVIPFNVAGNGTANSQFYSHNIQSDLELLEVILSNTTCVLLMSAPVCHAELTFEDVFSDADDIIMNNTILTIVNTAIKFDSQLLALNRKYRVRVAASNIHYSATSETIISTSDVTSCSALQERGALSISINFTMYSEATGALLCFIHIYEDGTTANLNKSLCLSLGKNREVPGLTYSLGLPHSGQYVVYAYDIESNGRMRDGTGYQASNCSLTLTNGQQAETTSPLFWFTVTSYNKVITVTCSFYSFQLVAQRNSLDRVGILYVNTSTDPFTPATLEVPENGEYLITVLPIQDGRGILNGIAHSQLHVVTNDNLTFIVTTQANGSMILPRLLPKKSLLVGQGIGLVALAFLVVLLAVTVTVLCCKLGKRKPEEEQSHEAIGIQLYEEIRESRDEVIAQRQAQRGATTAEYEDVVPTAKTDTNYHVTECMAYGVSKK